MLLFCRALYSSLFNSAVRLGENVLHTFHIHLV